MRTSREAVAIALFNQLKIITWGSGEHFQTATRRPTLAQNVPEGNQPYFALELLAENDNQESANVQLEKYVLHFRAYIYARADADKSVPGETLLNRILDAIDAALQNQYNKGEPQTLGGTVHNCWIEGIVSRSNGLVDDQMWMVIPIVADQGI